MKPRVRFMMLPGKMSGENSRNKEANAYFSVDFGKYLYGTDKVWAL